MRPRLLPSPAIIIGGRDLVEETVSLDFWSLGHRNESFRLDRVQVLVFGPSEGLPFPCFVRELGKGRTKESWLM